ncbi:MAG: hypothetical protein MK212_09805 [Saprospiraceae bacterium]|nr:hypothetical protein [Saprospiraceae bacterium]
MKKIILFLLIFYSVCTFGQETTSCDSLIKEIWQENHCALNFTRLLINEKIIKDATENSYSYEDTRSILGPPIHIHYRKNNDQYWVYIGTGRKHYRKRECFVLSLIILFFNKDGLLQDEQLEIDLGNEGDPLYWWNSLPKYSESWEGNEQPWPFTDLY